MPIVTKSPDINPTDAIDKEHESFSLDGVNAEDKKLIVLYVYRLPKFPTHGYKVGMAACHPNESFWHAIKKRVNEQTRELALTDGQYAKYGEEREVIYWGVCLDATNESFKDYHVHAAIAKRFVGLVEKEQEWFNGVPLEDLVDAFKECRLKKDASWIYTPRKEQRECVDALTGYFRKYPTGRRFLLNCKMRFGKCYTTYRFCEENGIDKILVLTFVPAVEESWEEDLSHIERHYDYHTDDDLKREGFELKGKPGPYVIFLSLQNYLGKDSASKETKEKIKKLQGIDFDLVVLDEYHFGAWNGRTQETLEDFEPDYAKAIRRGAGDQDLLKKFEISAKKTICLSGTPFKALARGEFNDENTFTYSYFDEQKNKYPNYESDDYKSVVNPDYEHFPDMRIYGYNMSHLFKGLSLECASDTRLLRRSFFSLDKFFETKKDHNPSLPNSFVYEKEIKEWLEIIKGRSVFGGDFPYSNPQLLSNSRHTLWLMPTISSCQAMADLLTNDDYFSKYVIANLSAPGVGAGQSALDYLNTKITESENLNKLGTIAITVNKLTLGVTVKPWMAVFVLKDLASPESYFQSIFRIQTPWVKDKQVLKKVGCVYDFNVDRAAALMLKFAEQSQDKTITKMKMTELIVKFMPIYMNGDMSSPISYEVFYDLALYGDVKGVPLSKRIGDIKKTTRAEDPDILSCMMNDPESSDILKRVFAHAKFKKTAERTPPSEPPPGFSSPAFKKGIDDGHKKGMEDYKHYIDFDDASIQAEFDRRLEALVRENTPAEYVRDDEIYYGNGYRKGYESGVNAPIKKLQCGKDDGVKFADGLRRRYGDQFFYEGPNKQIVDNAVAEHLNNPDSVPSEYKGKSLYTRWYKESFRKAARAYLKRPKAIADGDMSTEDASNVIQHIISRLFQFLYISVYRETTFDEIFKNADPEVFLEAVGIKKKDFEILNKYHIFQEDVLNNYIHEFFVNESLGASLDRDSKVVRENYRNSFGWFGFSEVRGSVGEYAAESLKAEVESHAGGATPKEEPISSPIEATEEEPKPEMALPKGLSPIEEKVYAAIWNICDLEDEMHCKPYRKTIRNYLLGNSGSVFYPSFRSRPFCGSMGFFESFKIDKALKSLLSKGIIELIAGKKEEYKIKGIQSRSDH